MKRIPLFALSLVMGTTQAFSPVTSCRRHINCCDNHHLCTTVLFAQQGNIDENLSLNRRNIIISVGGFLASLGSMSTPCPANAAGSRFILDEDTGDYIEVPEDDWQTTWSKRYEKAQSMSTDEIFKAARGAGNLDLKEGQPESQASRKRRAMSACRDSNSRSAAKVADEKTCTARVFAGETDFILGGPSSSS